jgi:hypothetical protein
VTKNANQLDVPPAILSRMAEQAEKALASGEWWIEIPGLDPIVNAERIDETLTPYEVVRQAERLSLHYRIALNNRNSDSASKPRKGKLPPREKLQGELDELRTLKGNDRDAMSALCRKHPYVDPRSIRKKLTRR